MRITRKQYLDNAGSDGNHRAYYAQFVTDDIKRLWGVSPSGRFARAPTTR